MNVRARVLMSFLASFGAAVCHAEILHADVLVSTSGTNNTIRYPNTSRNIAISPDGTFYVLYVSGPDIWVGRSTDRGATFDAPVRVSVPLGPPAFAGSSESLVAAEGAPSPPPEPEIAVDASGVVHVAWVDPNSSQLKYARSTNSGASFSTPVELAAESGTVHIATDDPYVYLMNRSGTTLYVNDDHGLGAFVATAVDSHRAYADVHVDPKTGDVYVQTDDPSVYVLKSTDNGTSFSGANAIGQNIYYSTTVLASTDDGVFLYTCGNGDTALRIDTSDYSATNLTFGTTTLNQGRTLAVDAYQNVIDGYVDGSEVKYAVSTDNGESFAPAVTIATADYLSLAINTRYGDIVAVYETAGDVFCTVYGSEIEQPTQLPEVTTAAATDVDESNVTLGGDVTYDGGEPDLTVGVCWALISPPTIDDNVKAIGVGSGTFATTIADLTPETTYYVRAFATNSAGTAYGQAIAFTTAVADPAPATAPDLRVAVEAETTTARVGDDVRTRINVSNMGTASATDVKLTIPLPAGTEFVGAWLVAGDAAQTTPLDAQLVNDAVVLDLGNVDINASRLIDLVIRALVAGAIEVNAAATSDEVTTPVSATVTAQTSVDDEYFEIVRNVYPLCGPLGFMPLVGMFGLIAFKYRRLPRAS